MSTRRRSGAMDVVNSRRDVMSTVVDGIYAKCHASSSDCYLKLKRCAEPWARAAPAEVTECK
eukprot:13331283-Heterocapsa_arctica.AAC.1